MLTKTIACCFFSIIAVSSLSYSATAQAEATQVYKWKDKNGVTHYADKPNSKNLANSIDVKVKRPLDGSQPQDTVVQSDTKKTDSSDPTKNWETDENGNKIPPNKTAACDVAKKNLNVLNDPNQIPLKNDASGKPVVLDEAARSQATKRAQDDVNLFCQ